MLKIMKDGTIQLTRGDTARIAVDLTNEVDNKEYVMQKDDTLVLSVKKTINDEKALIQKSLTGGNTFHIEPKDTAPLKFGQYKYDVQLTTADGDVFTVIVPTTFEIMAEVTCL